MEETISPAPEISSKLPESEAVTSSPVSSSNPKKLKSLWIIAVAVVLLILGVGGFIWFSSQSKNNQQATGKIYHVGVLSALDYFFPTVTGFKQKMTDLGYVEGKNIFYDVEKGPAPVGNQNIIKKFVQDKVDLILVFPTEASLEAKDGTKGTEIPIIVTEASVEGNGLVEGIQHPGGNITGVRFPAAEIAAKRLEILHQLAPKAKRIFIPYLKDYPTVKQGIDAVTPIAKTLGLTLIEVPFASPAEMEAYFNQRSTGDIGMDAVILIPEPVAITPVFTDQIFAFADTHKIPVGGASVLDSDKGSLFSLIPNPIKFGQLAAPLADKIFKGMPPGNIPIVTPESDLEINYKAITKLGLTVDEGLLSRATRIIR